MNNKLMSCANRLWNSQVIKLIHLRSSVNISHRLHTTNDENITSNNFVPIYRFPFIRHMSVINRLKVYQTFLTVTSIPSALILQQMDILGADSLNIITALGASGCLTLYGLGLVTTKFIGFIYFNEDQELAKISYVDFWGKRKDIVVPTNDIIPISELPTSYLDGLFLTMRRYSTKETLRLSLKFGVIEDRDKMNNVF